MADLAEHADAKRPGARGANQKAGPVLSTSWGTPPWPLEWELPPAGPPSGCDALVVGGGFCGLATALELARRGARVALLEASRPGAGASGRSGGLVLEETAAGPVAGLGSCLAALERVVERHAIDCQLQLGGCLELVHDEREPLWRDGEGVLSIAERLPGGSLHPGALLAGLIRAALDQGVLLCVGARVTGVATGRVFVGDTELEADAICLALNAYTAELLPGIGELSSALTLAVLSEPLAPGVLAELGLGQGQVFYTQDLPYLWGRPFEDRLLMGAGLATAEGGAFDGIDIALGEAAEQLDALEPRIRSLHPALRELSFERRWGGPVAFRRERLPLLTRLGERGPIVTGAFAGHGVALSFAIAEWIAAALAGERALPEWGA